MEVMFIDISNKIIKNDAFLLQIFLNRGKIIFISLKDNRDLIF